MVTEIVAGFWLIQVESREEAWAMRCPAELEVREVCEVTDSPAELQDAACSGSAPGERVAGPNVA